ncbi:MAG: hypothetical protein HY035_07975 [Nitrospirae bacterium]|nr:hypothetical protein [Nitrospirota bacterium]MBI3378319.1 hypothetical protein [Nitrospirota bacterium]
MQRKLRMTVLILVVLILFMITVWAYGATIVGSKHDLKHAYDVGSGLMKQTLNNYGEVCVYCHTPHAANTNSMYSGAPLWNRSAYTATYTVYGSPTMQTSPSNPPSGVSRACLSCHDGVLAADAIINAPGAGYNTGGPWYGQNAASFHYQMKEGANNCGECHTGGASHDSRATYLGTDLSKDHPISMTYPSSSQFNVASTVEGGGLKFYSGKVECPSCHNVHDPGVSPFLRKSNSGSALCLTCHIK